MIELIKVIVVVIFIYRAFVYIRHWIRHDFWLPRYIHVLAGVAALLGCVTVWALQQQGLGKSLPGNCLIIAMFPTIVYISFVVYGGVAAAPDSNSN